MNPLTIAAGMLAGLGLFLVIRALTPSAPRLDTALANLAPDPIRARRAVAPTPQVSLTQRAGTYLEHRLADIPFFAPPRADLELIGKPVSSYYLDKAATAMIGLALPAFIGLILQLLLGFPLVIPAIASLALGALMWFAPDADVKTKAAQRRTDFAYAVVSYIRLVAIQRLGQAGLVAAMEDAARTSDAWMFLRIREELQLALLVKRPPWDALADLAERIGVPELKEVADITRLAGESGASISGSLMARAASMRDRLLSAEHVEAVKASAGLTVPMSMLGLLFVVALIFPAFMTILS